MSNRRDLIVDVLEAVADADRVAVEELSITLADHVDPEVLVALSAMDEGSWEFTFELEDHEVTITSDGQLFVDGVLCRTDLPMKRRSS